MAWLLWQHAPRLALVTASLGIIGCVGGTNFLVTSIYRSVLLTAGLQQEELLWLAASNMATASLLVTVAMGPWFPLALIIFGIGLMRFKVIPVWLGFLLTAGGICFPLGRIPGDPLFFHIADALLLVTMSVLGWRYMRKA
jgi:hypothetical protein